MRATTCCTWRTATTAAVRAGLAGKGHKLEILGPWEGSGCEVMIQVDPSTGALCGAADPRRDGYAIGW